MRVAIHRPEIDLVVELAIESIAPNGKGKGSAVGGEWDKFSFFVPGVAPGDRIRAKVTGGYKRYVEADITELISAGPYRAEPLCPHFESCGGCQLMHLDYSYQLEAKRDVIRYVLRRRGFDPDIVYEVIASPRRVRYRLRSKLTITDKMEAGMRAWHSHDTVPICECLQMRDELERDLLRAITALPDSIAEPTDGLRQISGVLELGDNTVYMQTLLDNRPVASMPGWHVVRDGSLHRIEKPQCSFQQGEFELRYSPECFTQVNPEVNELLCDLVLKLVDPSPGDEILELYAGVGNFTLPLAKTAGRVAAVEFPLANEYAQINAQKAGLANITQMGIDVAQALDQLKENKEKFNKILLDPPRDGLGRRVCMQVVDMAPQKIVYVSCDPVTLSLDLQVMAEYGYRLTGIYPLDMFPQTFHVELCAVMEI